MNSSLSVRVMNYLEENGVGSQYEEYLYRCYCAPYIFYKLVPNRAFDDAIEAWKTVSRDSLTVNLNVFELLALAIEDESVYELPAVFCTERSALLDSMEFFLTSSGDNILDDCVISEIRARVRRQMNVHLETLFNLSV